MNLIRPDRIGGQDGFCCVAVWLAGAGWQKPAAADFKFSASGVVTDKTLCVDRESIALVIAVAIHGHDIHHLFQRAAVVVGRCSTVVSCC